MKFGWALLSLFCFALEAEAASRRIAIVMGNNAGTGSLPPLRYAENDAGKMARVLVELGEVSSEDLLLLQGRTPKDFERAIEDVRQRIDFIKTQPDMRSVLMFYFSGHSDGEALEIGKEKLPFSRLKTLLSSTGAELRLIIVDACRSGDALREKGGKPVDPFTIKLTDAVEATGEAFISSSAADEAALESSEVMGSLFTHNLVSGLRGAADTSGDHLVTLTEAYQYAYERTVAVTAMLPVGAQHPTYDYRLSGQGEWVLSSLLQSSARLLLPEGVERALILDVLRDQVLVEVPQNMGREIGLPPGQYGLQVLKGGKAFGTRVQIKPRSVYQVSWNEMKALGNEARVATKGAVSLQRAMSREADSVWSLSLGLTNDAVAKEVPFHGLFRLGFEPSEETGSVWAAVATLGTTSTARELSGQLRGGYRFVWSPEPFNLSLGLEAGPSFFWQARSGFQGTSLAATLAPRTTVRWKMGSALWLSLEAEAPMHLLRLDDALKAIWLPGAHLGLAWKM